MVVLRQDRPRAPSYTKAMYVLHYAPDNASMIVRLALEHTGLPYRTALVDRSVQAQRSPAYLALNPNGLIPALETPDGVMFETTATLLYLSERAPGLMPDAGAPRAMALKWLAWLGNTLHPAQRMLFYPEQYTHADPEALRAPTRHRIQRLLTILSDAQDAPWLDGAPSAPTFYLGPLLRWLCIYGGPAWFDLAAFPRLQSFCAALEQTASMTRTAAAEGLGTHPLTRPSRPNPPEGSAL